MTDFEKKIISELKQALEFKEINSDYSQWLQGVSLPTIIERKNNHLSLTARVVVTRDKGTFRLSHCAQWNISTR